MPQITRIFIKTALLYFVAALLLGILLAARAWLPESLLLGGLWPVYWHLFMLGWVTQLIVGIAYWMFPKFSRAMPRGSDRLAWATWGLLNGGLLLRVVGEPALAAASGDVALNAARLVVAASALLQWAGGMTFLANTWQRVKEK